MVEIKTNAVYAVIIIVIFVTAVAESQKFRFSSTHSITKESYCYDCHGQELKDVAEGTHLPSMPLEYQTRFLDDYYNNYFRDFQGAGKSEQEFLDSLCQSCHMNTMQFYHFELTDPYIFNSSSGFDYIYGKLDFRNSSELSRINDQVVWTDLRLKAINPENATIHLTLSILLEDFSHHQGNTTSFVTSGILGQGDQLILNTSGIYPDYFSILLIIDSVGWDYATFEIGLSGTSDDGYFPFTLNKPGNYFLPYYISRDPYFHTMDYYKAARLDMAYSDFREFAIGNISSLEGINTTSRTGAAENVKTCSSQDGMCHIVQKTASLGSTIGFNGPDGRQGFYRHDMPYTTSSGNCLLCHINGLSS